MEENERERAIGPRMGTPVARTQFAPIDVQVDAPDTFQGGKSLVPDDSHFMASRTYAATEGGAGYWALGRTPMRVGYDWLTDFDDRPDPLFFKSRRSALVSAITPELKEKWGEDFMHDLETTSVSEKHFMYRIQYRMDVDRSLAVMKYYDDKATTLGYGLQKTVNAVGNYMASDPITAITTIGTLGLSALPAAGMAAVRATAAGVRAAATLEAANAVAAAGKAERAVSMASALWKFNQVHGTMIRYGSVGANTLDGIVSGYGQWAGANRDQKLIYGDLAQIDDNPGFEMAFGAFVGIVGGGVGAAMHAKQFGAKASNPFAGDPVAEVCAAAGVDLPTSTSMGERFLIGHRMDRLHTNMKAVPDIDEPTAHILADTGRLADAGWRTVDDLDELATFAAKKPTGAEMKDKILSRLTMTERNMNAQARHQQALTEWRAANPGRSQHDYDGVSIVRLAEARLKGRVPNAAAAARSLLDWVDNRKWVGAINGRSEMARWLGTIADDNDIVRLIEFRNWEFTQAAEETKALATATARIDAIHAKNSARSAAVGRALADAKAIHINEQSLIDAQHAISQGRWAEGINHLNDAQEKLLDDTSKSLGLLKSTVSAFNEAQRKIVTTTGAVIEDMTGVKLAEMVETFELVETAMRAHRARMNTLRQRIATSTDPVQLDADLKSLLAEQAFRASDIEPRIAHMRNQMGQFQATAEAVSEMFNKMHPEQGLALDILGKKMLEDISGHIDGLPVQLFEVLDDAHISMAQRHAKVAIHSQTTAIMEGRMFLGSSEFDNHLLNGTMPLSPQAPTIRSVRLPGMPTLPKGEKILTGADLVAEEDRILLEEMQAASGRRKPLPTNVTIDEVVAKAEADIASANKTIENIKGLAPIPDVFVPSKTGGVGKHIPAPEAAHRQKVLAAATAKLDAATKVRDKMNKKLGKMEALVERAPEPVAPIAQTARTVRQAEKAAARLKAAEIKTKIEELLKKGDASPDDVAKLQAMYRRQMGILHADTAYGRAKIALRMVSARVREASSLAATLRKQIDDTAGIVGMAAHRTNLENQLKRVNEELNIITKEETKLTAAIKKRDDAIGSNVRVGGRDRYTAGNHVMAAIWRAKREVAAAAGDDDAVNRLSHNMLALVGDERTAANFPTLTARMIGKDGKLDPDANMWMKNAKILDDGSVMLSDGTVHAQSNTPVKPPVTNPRAKPARDMPSGADDEDMTRALDDFSEDLLGDDDFGIANANTTLIRLREVPLFRGLTNLARRAMTVHTGASQTLFSHFAKHRRSYEMILALSRMVDDPLAAVRDFGGKAGLHMRSMHAIRAEVRGMAVSCMRDTQRLSRGVPSGWHVRIRSALIRNDPTGLSSVERQIFQRQRQFYDHFSDVMRRRGFDVPEGYVPSMHNTGHILARRQDCTRRLADSYYRLSTRATEALDDEMLLRAGIPRTSYHAGATVGNLTPAQRVDYDRAAREISDIEANRSISRMTGGIDEEAQLGVVAGPGNWVRRIRYHDSHTDSGFQRRFSNEILTDPTLEDLWVHNLHDMAATYADGGGSRLMIDDQLSQAVGRNVTMSELLFHATGRLKEALARHGDQHMEEELKKIVQTIEEKMMYNYGQSGVLRAKNTSRGQALLSTTNGLVRAKVGSMWALQTVCVELPKAIWYNAGRSGFTRAMRDFGDAALADRHLLDDYGVTLEALQTSHASAMSSADGLTGNINMTMMGRIAAPWRRAFSTAMGETMPTSGSGGRILDTVAAGAEALGDTAVRMGGLQGASNLTREVAVRGATRQLYRLARILPALAADMRALPRAVGNNVDNVRRIREIARRHGIRDHTDLLRMNQHGMFREEVADNMHQIIGGMNDPDELFDIMRLRGQLSDASMGSVMDYVDEAAHLAVPTQRASSALTGRTNNAYSSLYFMLTSYTRAFGLQNMTRLGAQTAGMRGIQGMGILYAGEVLYQSTREVLNGRETVEGTINNWHREPDKEMYKIAGRIPSAGVYTGLMSWAVNPYDDRGQTKFFSPGAPVTDLMSRAYGAVKEASQGRFGRNSNELLQLAPIYGSWQAKATMKAFGIQFGK